MGRRRGTDVSGAGVLRKGRQLCFGATGAAKEEEEGWRGFVGGAGCGV